MTTFLDSLAINLNDTRTTNGDLSYRSTLDANLDFFALGGALRQRKDEFVRLFRLAYAEDPLTALRTLFYFRDIRGGQGERDLFRAAFADLRQNDRKNFILNLINVPFYGRWDDIFESVGLDNAVLETIEDQLRADIISLNSSKPVSLLAKWLPSENASSKLSKAQARAIARYVGLTPREYRRTLTGLRTKINILETKMSQKDWESIDYGVVPSQAIRKHVKAFQRNDGTRYDAFLSAVESGEKKINATTLMTYEIYDMVSPYTYNPDDRTANALWEALPDYTNGSNAIVVADVSGSMTGRPMSISVSLALYFAERNTGPFNGYFMTFSERPELVKVRGDNLSQRIRNISSSNWGMNTNLSRVFDEILAAAQTNGATAEDLPKTVYVISDMQFDRCVSADESTFRAAKRKFTAAGFELPHVVFWNVNANDTQFPVTKFEGNVSLFSGSSQSTFQYAVAGKTPLETMVLVLTSERYNRIAVV
jgi:hypothetical protein